MKKFLVPIIFLLLIAIAFLLPSCKKDNGPGPSTNPNILYFGAYNPFSDTLAPSSKFYILENSKLYVEPMMFDGVATPAYIALLPDSLYQIARYLIDSFPPYLIQHTGDTAIGCPGCADGNILKLWAVSDSTTIKWNINTDTSQLPVEIRQYVWKAGIIINEL